MSKIRSDLVGIVTIPTDSGEPLILKAGDTVPKGVKVGGHVLEGHQPATEVPAKPSRK